MNGWSMSYGKSWRGDIAYTAVSMLSLAWTWEWRWRFPVVWRAMLSTQMVNGNRTTLIYKFWSCWVWSKAILFKRHEATSAIWQETFLSALLRAILYSDDSYYRLAGYRKIDPITSLSAEAKFLEAAENLFWQGKGFEHTSWSDLIDRVLLNIAFCRMATGKQAWDPSGNFNQ